MKIGEVIRTYRKEKQMTQEEMANYLGVTAPAVNKWENDNSYPDISLLAPIARLLGITTDTLLSYQDELTEQEIKQIVTELETRMLESDYDTWFHWGMSKVQQYPNSDKLAIMVTRLLRSYGTIVGLDNEPKYDDAIVRQYEKLLDSADPDIVQETLFDLYLRAISREEYDEAQKYLDQIPNRKIDTRTLKASLCVRQGKIEEAYEAYERIIYMSCTDIQNALGAMISLELQKGEVERAELFTGKLKEVLRALDMGRYMEKSAECSLAVYKKDKDACISILEETLETAGFSDSIRQSELYRHMKFAGSDSARMNTLMGKMLLKDYDENDDSISFLKDDKRFQELIKKAAANAEEMK
ncbi:helix-turn-helix domain-containing protein [Blautia schinkii]|nr:helix-turn-helix domain-containing protein [Blautia schinkii]